MSTNQAVFKGYALLLRYICKAMSTDKVSIKQLLDLIPDEELARLSVSTKVDYQVKTLYGRSMFYLLLYGLITCEKASLRGLEDTFNSNRFKVLFNLDPDQTTRHNSLSDRLATMQLSFFENAYEFIYQIFRDKYSEQEAATYNIVRVDSTMVAETANKLVKGMSVGCKKDGKNRLNTRFAWMISFLAAYRYLQDKAN